MVAVVLCAVSSTVCGMCVCVCVVCVVCCDCLRLRLKNGCGVSCRSLGQQHYALYAASTGRARGAGSGVGGRAMSRTAGQYMRVAGEWQAVWAGAECRVPCFGGLPRAHADAAVKAERCGAWGGGWAMLLQGQGEFVPVTTRDTEHGRLRLDSSEMPSACALGLPATRPEAARTRRAWASEGRQWGGPPWQRRVPGLDPAYRYGRPATPPAQDRLTSHQSRCIFAALRMYSSMGISMPVRPLRKSQVALLPGSRPATYTVPPDACSLFHAAFVHVGPSSATGASSSSDDGSSSCSSMVQISLPVTTGNDVSTLLMSPHHTSPNRRYQSTVMRRPSSNSILGAHPSAASFEPSVAYRWSLNGRSGVCSTHFSMSAALCRGIPNTSSSR